MPCGGHLNGNPLIRDVVMTDRQVMVCEIAEIVGISTERIHNVLHKKLHVKKFCAQRLLCSLPTKKNARDRTFQRTVCLFNRAASIRDCERNMDPPLCISSECKQQSEQRTMNGESAPTIAKTVPSVNKVVTTVFFYS